MIPTPIAAALSPRYAIRRELGRGGMARVYLADDVRHGRQVAIKTMLPEVSAAIGRDRFLREIETAARLTHPNILPLFDSGEAEGHLWYVTPFIEGESLRQRLTRDGPLSVPDAVRVIRGVAAALDHAHRQGVVHRDIKPENILVADGIALVADFGIARAMVADADSETSATRDVGLTGSGMTVGTPRYMAPEQFGRADVDGRADLYAMGCVLFEMLTGEPPFDGTTLADLMRAHLAEAPRSIAESRPEAGGNLSEAVRRLLAKQADERPATGAAFLVLLDGARLPAAMSALPNNLPRERTSFVGREKDVATAGRLLDEARLLTITGIGGCGKTRLALRLARERLGAF
ncbi:MAG TPA: serine/threonine-protein kinase, partial [Candidatus Eisenbacteria bacterium]